VMLAAIPSPSQNVLHLGPLTIHAYGVLIAIGVIVAVVVAKHRYARFGGEPELVERVAIWVVVIGFLGARAGFVTTHTGLFVGRPWAVLFIWEGGLALYGGLTAGAIAAIVLMRRWDGDLAALADAVAVGLPLAQAIGRWGNYFNQELFGVPTDLPWGLRIDPVNRPPGYEQFSTFHPTFLYEALWNVLLTVPIILFLERRGKLAKGASLPVYLVVYGTGRFLMELLRTDTTFRLFGLSRNAYVSLLAIAVGVVAYRWMQRRGERRVSVGTPRLLSPVPAAAATGPVTETRPAGGGPGEPPGEPDSADAGPPVGDLGEGSPTA